LLSGEIKEALISVAFGSMLFAISKVLHSQSASGRAADGRLASPVRRQVVGGESPCWEGKRRCNSDPGKFRRCDFVKRSAIWISLVRTHRKNICLRQWGLAWRFSIATTMDALMRWCQQRWTHSHIAQQDSNSKPLGYIRTRRSPE